MKLTLKLVLIIGIFTSSKLLAIDLIKHIPSDKKDNQTSYFIQLLHLALQKSEQEHGPFQLQSVDTPMGQQRQFKSVNDGSLDVLWAMTSKAREEQAIPIRIPLLKGLLGYRIFVIRTDQVEQFSNINNIEDIKKLTAVQGFDWPDLDILKANNFTVVDSEWYNTIFKSLSKGFYDYFPRSIIEVSAELEYYDTSLLSVDQKHLLIYPTAIYFFVGKHQAELAHRIESGLSRAIDDGSFHALFTQYPSHQQTFNKIELQKRTKYFLHNPLLPEKTPINNARLWFAPLPTTKP
ncbi:hypothetical protein [Paraglaciecola sp.]|uniref:hypothetical protein n=1 Tax=Paraglaciecola sp. TaxID=1920173 RepID=UPI003EF9B3B1